MCTAVQYHVYKGENVCLDWGHACAIHVTLYKIQELLIYHAVFWFQLRLSTIPNCNSWIVSLIFS